MFLMKRSKNLQNSSLQANISLLLLAQASAQHAEFLILDQGSTQYSKLDLELGRKKLKKFRTILIRELWKWPKQSPRSLIWLSWHCNKQVFSNFWFPRILMAYIWGQDSILQNSQSSMETVALKNAKNVAVNFFAISGQDKAKRCMNIKHHENAKNVREFLKIPLLTSEKICLNTN